MEDFGKTAVIFKIARLGVIYHEGDLIKTNITNYVQDLGYV